jgi:osmotically-inducible protein OsmY
MPRRKPGDDGMNLLAPTSTAHEKFSDFCLSTICRTAEDRFRASGYLALRDISCIASDGVAYLHGCLPSYYLKQLAQEIAAAVEGVSLVVNKIEVKAPARTNGAVPANDSF